MVHSDAVHVFRCGLHNSRPYKVVMHSEACGEISEHEFHPACPEQQCAEESPDGALGVALHEHSDHRHRQTYKSHDDSTGVHGAVRHRVFHDSHHGMAERHREQYKDKRGDSLPPILLFVILHNYGCLI